MSKKYGYHMVIEKAYGATANKILTEIPKKKTGQLLVNDLKKRLIEEWQHVDQRITDRPAGGVCVAVSVRMGDKLNIKFKRLSYLITAKCVVK